MGPVGVLDQAGLRGGPNGQLFGSECLLCSALLLASLTGFAGGDRLALIVCALPVRIDS
jgi:hypothetical protein